MQRVLGPSLGLYAFDVNRTRCAALYVGLYVQSRVVLMPELQSRVVLLPGVCVLDVCSPRLGLSAIVVNRTRCAALYVGLYVQSRVVLTPELQSRLCSFWAYERSICAGRA